MWFITAAGAGIALKSGGKDIKLDLSSLWVSSSKFPRLPLLLPSGCIGVDDKLLGLVWILSTASYILKKKQKTQALASASKDFMDTAPKTAVFEKKKKEKEILQGAVDTAGFMKLKKISLLFSVCMTWEIYLMKKKSCRPTLEKYRWRLIFFSAGICQGIPTLSETPKRLHTQSNTRTLQVYRFSKSHKNPGLYFTFFLAIISKKQIFFVIFVSSFAALFL